MHLLWPVEAPLTQEFGANPNSIQPHGHTGRDYGVPVGTVIRAIGTGTVLFADWATKLAGNNRWLIAPNYAGICVLLDHGGLVSVYAHLSETLLNPGDVVAQGKTVGLSGRTGLATGPHLHFEVFGWPLAAGNGFYGRLDPRRIVDGQPEGGKLEANQRYVGAFGVTERTAADPGATPTGRVFKAGDALTFRGFERGVPANGTNIWFIGAFSEGRFSASAFDDQGTHDLPDLTPAPVAAPLLPYQRQTGMSVVNYRTAPSTSAPLLTDGGTGQLAADTIYDFKGYVNAEGRTWFVGRYSGGYAAAEFFTDSGTHDLADLTPAPTAPPVTTPTTPPPVAKYDFEVDFPFCEKAPAAIGNFQGGGIASSIANTVCHWWGDPTIGISLQSVIGEFQRTGSFKSAHFVVSGKRIVQMVSLKDRAYHAGPTGNDYIGIEIDPRFDPDTIASVKKLLEALRGKYGAKQTLWLHRNVPGNNTLCSGLDLSKLEIEVAVQPPLTPPPAETTPAVPPAGPLADLPAVRRFLDWLYTLYSSALKGK